MSNTRYGIGVSREQYIRERLFSDLEQLNLDFLEIVPDVCYSQPNGSVSQIDAVLVCDFGVYCLEFKSWQGVIYPSPSDKWAVNKTTNEGVSKYVTYFPNPVSQNAGHRAMLLKLILKQVPKVMMEKIENYVLNPGWAKFDIYNVVIFDDQRSLLDFRYFDKVPRNIVTSSSAINYIKNKQLGHKISVGTLECKWIVDFLKYLRGVNKPIFDEAHKRTILKSGLEVESYMSKEELLASPFYRSYKERKGTK